MTELIKFPSDEAAAFKPICKSVCMIYTPDFNPSAMVVRVEVDEIPRENEWKKEADNYLNEIINKGVGGGLGQMSDEFYE